MDNAALYEILLTLLRKDKEAHQKVAVLKGLSTVEWTALLHLAAQHTLTPLLYHHIRLLGKEISLPSEALRGLQASYLSSSRNSYQYKQVLTQVLEQLEPAKIPVIALKGAFLSNIIYSQPALRPMVDLDLLVRSEHLEAVDQALLNNGWLPDLLDKTNQKHQIYRYPETELLLEIHWHINSPQIPFVVNIDDFWARAQPVTIGGKSLLALSVEDLLLHLEMHLYAHQFDKGLRPLCDIDEVIRYYRDQIDWPQVEIRARAQKCSQSLHLALWLAKEFLGTPVPEEILADLQPENFSIWGTIAKNQILAYQPTQAKVPPAYGQILVTRTFLGKVGIILKAIFPSPQYMAMLYPEPAESMRIYLYYPVRLLELMSRNGKTFWKLVRRDENAISRAQEANHRDSFRDWLKKGYQ